METFCCSEERGGRTDGQTDREAVFWPPSPPWNAGLQAARKDRRDHLLSLLCACVLLTITTHPPLFHRRVKGGTERKQSAKDDRAGKRMSQGPHPLYFSGSQAWCAWHHPIPPHRLCPLSRERPQHRAGGGVVRVRGHSTQFTQPQSWLGASEAEPAPVARRGGEEGQRQPVQQPSQHPTSLVKYHL